MIKGGVFSDFQGITNADERGFSKGWKIRCVDFSQLKFGPFGPFLENSTEWKFY